MRIAQYGEADRRQPGASDEDLWTGGVAVLGLLEATLQPSAFGRGSASEEGNGWAGGVIEELQPGTGCSWWRALELVGRSHRGSYIEPKDEGCHGRLPTRILGAKATPLERLRISSA